MVQKYKTQKPNVFMQDISWLLNVFLEYGYLGLFLSSFIGSTIFVPFTVEVFMAALLGAGLNAIYLIFIASLGSTLGSCLNYFLGWLGIKYYRKKVKKAEKENSRLEEIVNRYGVLGLFVILALPLPLPVDIFTLAAGISRMNFKYFVVAVFFGKLVRYAFYAEIVMVII